MPADDNASGNCPIHYALGGLGDKWSLLVIRDLMFFGKRYYNEFLASPEGISTNILADRLARLERHGIVEKIPTGEGRSRFRYTLTGKGLDLMPVLLELINWSASHDPDSGAPRQVVEEFRANRGRLLRRLRGSYLGHEEQFGHED